MPRGSINTALSVNTWGDLLTIFKPINQILGSSNSKIMVPLNLINRRSRRIAYALLEVLVESTKITPEWRLKIDNISITRQFKPTYVLSTTSGQKCMYKFVYDITSILNTYEILDKESVNLLLKYEGGDFIVVRGVLLDSIYEDNDAQTTYKHLTGLLSLDGGERARFDISDINTKPVVTRLIIYSPRKTTLEICAGGKTIAIQTPQEHLDEYIVVADGKPEHVEIFISDQNSKESAILSSITLYNSFIKQPVLELCGYDHTQVERALKLRLNICNKGEASPEKLIISIFRKGKLLTSITESNITLLQSREIVKEIEIPEYKFDELQARLIWLKLTRRWIKDYTIKLF